MEYSGLILTTIMITGIFICLGFIMVMQAIPDLRSSWGNDLKFKETMSDLRHRVWIHLLVYIGVNLLNLYKAGALSW